MKHWLRWLFTSIVGCMIFSVAMGNTLVSKHVEFPAVVMTYADLSQLIEDVKSLAQKANINVPNATEVVSLAVSTDTDSVTIKGQSKLIDVPSPPPVGRSVRFSYYIFNAPAPISEITIVLTDSTRAVDVAGLDQTQVTAITSYIAQRLDNYTTVLTGPRVRIVTFVILYFIGFFLMFVTGPKPTVVNLVRGFGLICLVMGMMILFLNWFPGTAVHLASASIIDRNINAIGFIGVLLTVLIPAVMFFVQRVQSRTKPEEPG